MCRVFRAFTTHAFAAAADRRRRYRHRHRRRIFGRPFGRARARIRSGQAPGFFRDSREGGRGTRSGVCWRRRRRRRQGAPLSLTHSSIVTATLVDERRCRHRRYTAALRTAAAFLVVVRHGHTAHRGRLCTHDARCSKSLFILLLRTLEFYRNVRNMTKLL